MIQWMHRLSKSWVAVILMGMLGMSFVVWGIADVFTGGSSNAVITVGRTEIGTMEFQRVYRNFLRNQGQQMGTDITPELAQKMGLANVALQQLVSRTALNNEAARLGLVTPDVAVAQNVRDMAPFKGATGDFDRQTFVQAITGAGYTEGQFMEEVRQDMTRDQLTRSVESHFIVPPTYAQALFLYINEKRAADYVIVSPEAVGPIAPPSEAVLAAYVKANTERFSTPEYRSLDYAMISPEDVKQGLTVTDQQIKEEYDARKSTYQVPERREIHQIEFKTQKEAADARARITSGTGFDAFAETRGLKPTQTLLGDLAQSDIPDDGRAKAIFALPLNETSQPIQTGFGGWVLARVTKITPGISRSLDDVREEIRENLILRLASNKMADAVNGFTDARSNGDDLNTAAKKSGLRLGHLPAVDARGLAPDGTKTDAPADPEFLTTAFAAEVGEDGDPFPSKSGSYYVLRVNGSTPPKLKTMDVVRDEAREAWITEQRNKLMDGKTRALVEKASKEKSLDGVARELKVSVQKSPALGRDTNDTMFSAAIITKLFAAPAGGVVSGPQGLSGNHIIARVTGIAHPTPNPNDPEFIGGMQRLSGSVAQDLTVSLANAARARQGVRVNQRLLDQTTGQGS